MDVHLYIVSEKGKYLHSCYGGGNADRHCCAGGLCAAGHGFVAIAIAAEESKECGEHSGCPFQCLKECI